MTLPKPMRATGSHFYKYSTLKHVDRLQTIILEHELYLPNLRELNDPADGLPKLTTQSADEMASFFYDQFITLHPDLTAEEREREAETIRYNVMTLSPEAIQPMIVEALDGELRDYRIYSLTKRFDNMNLWAQYADGHRGFCLEFANTGPLFEHAKEVSYLDPAQISILITDRAIKDGDFFFCKTKDWATEEEVRLVLPRGKGYKVKIDPNWLSRIILGKDMPEANRELIRQWANRRKPELVVVTAVYDPVNRAIRLKG